MVLLTGLLLQRFSPPLIKKIPAPEAFLEYGIGSYHTRHDLIVAYLTKLAEVSDRASIETYGKTHEGRKTRNFLR